ncbi:glycosyltransferase 87 family protein [Corynebacterium tapiri]|uniref:DUF2029 domain-containing protein n=1 Tax=Corynebacterium tapiri TaxID=1448266 RepID=A0A5C4U6W1_9CORY|nr:glycosyltransferase 87 family protein [Corynebacterium tapiri]TNL99415.1 DUF2029 domain-containing protein [Corynebacterium tapiri]
MSLPTWLHQRRFTPLPVCLALAIVGYWLIDVPGNLAPAYHLDTDVYRHGAQAFVDGADLYSLNFELPTATLPFTYPPFAALLFVPMTWMSLGIAGLVLSVSSLACLWWVLRLCCQLAGVSRPGILAAWLLPVFTACEPVVDTISFGQINLILLALVATDVLWISGRRHWMRGVCSGLAAAIKLTPAVFVLSFVVERDRCALARLVLAALGATALAALVAPQISLDYFLHTLTETSRIGSQEYATNQSISGVLARLGQPATGLAWLTIAGASGVLALLAAWRVRHYPLASLACISCIALLCSPISWSHHWVWGVVLVMACIVANQRVTQLGGLALWLLFLIAPHRFVPRGAGAELGWSFWQHLVGNAYVLAAIAFLVVAAVVPRAFYARVGRDSARR